MRKLIYSLLLIITLVPAGYAGENFLDREDVKNFLNEMVNKHGFSREELISVFSRGETAMV